MDWQFLFGIISVFNEVVSSVFVEYTNTYKLVLTKKNMKPKIKISGTASLKELYRNPKDRIYYAVLSATVEAEGADKYVSPKLNIEFPITEEHYNLLRKKLDESKAEVPVLRVKGNLELVLDYVCIN